MKLLFISQSFPYPPYLNGGTLKAYSLLRYLSLYNEIYLLTFALPGEEQYRENIVPFCSKVVVIPYCLSRKQKLYKKVHDLFSPKRFQSALMEQEIRKAVHEWRPDIAHFDLPMMAQYAGAVGNVPKVMASHDTISLFAYKTYRKSLNPISKSLWYLLFKQRQRIEKKYFPLFDICTVVSKEDKMFLFNHCSVLKVKVIPNGVDIEYFKKSAQGKSEPLSIGIFGGMNFAPNLDAALFFLKEIYPLIRKTLPVKLYIVGRTPSGKLSAYSGKNGVIVTGETDDMRVYYEKVSVVVSPVRLGSGIKNTVLQAMAMSKPVVATSQAVRAIGVTNGVDISIADTPANFSAAVIELLSKREVAERIGVQARELIEENFSWEHHAEVFQNLYQEVISCRSK